MTSNTDLIKAVQAEVSALRILCQDLETRMKVTEDQVKLNAEKTSIHEKILVIGDGDRLPLAEVVRNLTRTVHEYIEAKNRQEKELEREKKEERTRWKWAVIGIILPAVLLFISQAIVFYFRVFPILEKMAQ